LQLVEIFFPRHPAYPRLGVQHSIDTNFLNGIDKHINFITLLDIVGLKSNGETFQPKLQSSSSLTPSLNSTSYSQYMVDNIGDTEEINHR
jgi:hypothetical protein